MSVQWPGVLGNDVAPDGDWLDAWLVSQPQNGTLSWYDDGSFDYYPYPGFWGTDTFTYVAADENWYDAWEDTTPSAWNDVSAPVTVTINVRSLPQAEDDFYSMAQGQQLLELPDNGVLANDVNPDGRPMEAELGRPRNTVCCS